MSSEASAAEELAEQGTQVTAGESCGVQAEYREDVQERLGAGVSQAQPGDAGSVVADEGVAGGVQDFGTGMGSWLSRWTARSRRLAYRHAAPRPLHDRVWGSRWFSRRPRSVRPPGFSFVLKLDKTRSPRRFSTAPSSACICHGRPFGWLVSR
jgi:hypothetical protein